MASSQTVKVVLFDLDNTLFDHGYSLQTAISAVQAKYTSLAGYRLEQLVAKYNVALQLAYDKYLSKEITYEESNAVKVQLFCKGLGLPEPTPDQVQEFRSVYKPAYRGSRRATPGAVETLARLRERGYRLAIVTNGQIEDQTSKAEQIGVSHLVDHIITSEEAGYPKPDRRIFELAVERMGVSPCEALMVGDSVDTDITGALEAGLSAVLYSPTSKDSSCCVLGKETPVIRQMTQLFEHVAFVAES